MCACMRGCMHVYVYADVYVYGYVDMYMYVYILYVYVFVSAAVKNACMMCAHMLRFHVLPYLIQHLASATVMRLLACLGQSDKGFQLCKTGPFCGPGGFANQQAEKAPATYGPTGNGPDQKQRSSPQSD